MSIILKTIINDNQRGLLFRNGLYSNVLNPGKHTFFGYNTKVEVCQISDEFIIKDYDINVFLNDETLKQQLMLVNVPDGYIALRFVDGNYKSFIKSGKYAFWNIYKNNEFKLIDMRSIEVDSVIEKNILELLPTSIVSKCEVKEYQKGGLYIDKKFVRLLDEGIYYFWNCGLKIHVNIVDTRIMQPELLGQEIMTFDRVGLRINFVCSYKIIDYIRIYSDVEDYKNQLYIALQMELREYIARYKLDEIMDNKETISTYVLEKIKEKEAALFVEVISAGVKDIILPGEVRDIMNMVLIAEKKAQANVITRREEVAATRSLLNTAKLMDENQTLMKLKELEYLEKICENVGNITVNGGTDLLSQLTHVLRG